MALGPYSAPVQCFELHLNLAIHLRYHVLHVLLSLLTPSVFSSVQFANDIC